MPQGSEPIVAITAIAGEPSSFVEVLEIWLETDEWALVTSALWETRVLPHVLGFVRAKERIAQFEAFSPVNGTRALEIQ